MKYGRVSSKEQEKEGFSVPAQFKLIDQYAQSQGLKVVREFVDVETAKRPGNNGKCPEPYAREEVLEACFADLLKGLVFDDQVMDWIVDALHQSHAEEKRFRRDALARLQDEQSKLQNRLDKLYDDRLDGFMSLISLNVRHENGDKLRAFSRSDRRV